jgi:membrane protein implicated in regulation of membrane protease activity
MFWLMRRNKKYRIVTGKQGLVGSEVEVLSKRDRDGAYTVRVQGELWTAHSASTLESGERARVTKVDGMDLTVEPLSRVKNISGGMLS